VARRKGNLPELFGAAQARFAGQPPTQTCTVGAHRVELWDAADFDPWEPLRGPTVRVLRYRQHKPEGTAVEAYWLTDFPAAQVSSPTLFRLAKSRWEVENQGFNEGKTAHGLEHICHPHANSLLIGWLLVSFALTLERHSTACATCGGARTDHAPRLRSSGSCASASVPRAPRIRTDVRLPRHCGHRVRTGAPPSGRVSPPPSPRPRSCRLGAA